ncbi:MAG TPA: PLP-dependent aminotransferase family protein [Puia sp.]
MSKQSRQISLPFIRIDKKSARPLYEQLYDGIREAILKGYLQPNDRLPATRLIAEEWGISRNVVVLAFEQLILEGYLHSRSGSGSFVAGDIPGTPVRNPGRAVPENGSRPVTGRLGGPFVHQLRRSVLIRNTMREEVIPFQTSVPAADAFPFAMWSKLAARVYRYLDFQHLGYDDAAGHLPLREAIADHLRVNRAVSCTADRVLIVNGSQQALSLVAQLLLQPGDRYWIEDPGYVNARVLFNVNGGQPCPVPVTTEGLDIEYAFRHYPKARLAYLTPSHQYPLGGTLPLAQRLKLLAWANEHRLWLIEDDYDSELRYQGKPIPSLQGLDPYGNVIYMGTFSKVLFPALRVAYLVLPDEELFQSFKLLKALNDRQTTLTDQLILADFIKEGHFHRHLRKMRVLYNQRLQYLLGQLKEHLSGHLSFSDPAAGMHLAAYYKQPVQETFFLEKAREKGLILHSIKDYTLTHYDRPGILLGYSSFPEEKIKEGVRLLKDVFDS